MKDNLPLIMWKLKFAFCSKDHWTQHVHQQSSEERFLLTPCIEQTAISRNNKQNLFVHRMRSLNFRVEKGLAYSEHKSDPTMVSIPTNQTIATGL